MLCYEYILSEELYKKKLENTQLDENLLLDENTNSISKFAKSQNFNLKIFTDSEGRFSEMFAKEQTI